MRNYRSFFPLTAALALVGGSLFANAVVHEDTVGLVNDISYVPSDENFPNPERGFFHAQSPFFLNTERTPLSAAGLRAYRMEGISLVRAMYVIDEFRESPLPAVFLGELAADLAAVRNAGVKIIPRFAYSFPCAGTLEPCGPENFGVTDVPLARVLAHIDQLAPVLQANADVLAFMEMGFVGAWGEWHNSTNGLVNLPNHVNANSAAIVQRILSALPITRMAALRYPYNKQALFGPQPLTSAQAFSGLPSARVGAHNDCFLSNASDGGTYQNGPAPDPELFKQYLSADNRYVPQGGETCSSAPEAQPYIGCANALADLSRMRWSTINTDYQPVVIDLWKAQGCYAEIARRLGYRFRLVGAEVPSTAAAGAVLRVRVGIANDGWAAPYNARGVELILRHSLTRRIYTVPIPIDPRFWSPGLTHVVDLSGVIPANVDPGPYDVLLNLPDPEPALHDRADYSIRLANTGTWESSTGYNNLLSIVSITTGAPVGLVLEPPVVSGTTVTLRWSTAAPGVTDFLLEAGTATGASDLYNASIGLTTSLSAQVAPGTYFVRVRVRSALGISPPSNEVSFTIGSGGCQSVPPPPTGVSGAVVGGTATLRWNAVAGASSYGVEAGSSPGLANLFSGNVGATTTISSPVPAGFRAHIRVRAVNACGQGPPSVEILLQ